MFLITLDKTIFGLQFCEFFCLCSAHTADVQQGQKNGWPQIPSTLCLHDQPNSGKLCIVLCLPVPECHVSGFMQYVVLGNLAFFQLAKYTHLTLEVMIHCYPYLLCCSDSPVLAVESPFKLAPVIFGYVIMFPALLSLLAPQASRLICSFPFSILKSSPVSLNLENPRQGVKTTCSQKKAWGRLLTHPLQCPRGGGEGCPRQRVLMWPNWRLSADVGLLSNAGGRGLTPVLSSLRTYGSSDSWHHFQTACLKAIKDFKHGAKSPEDSLHDRMQSECLYTDCLLLPATDHCTRVAVFIGLNQPATFSSNYLR